MEEIRQIRAYVRIPLIIKGIMTAEEALSCVEAGVDAIVVSNHGGRVLDHVPATCSVLEGIVAAVGGRIPVLVDGGVRSGVDVFKMLALGADAVLIGRTFAQYAIGGGEEAVDLYIRKLQNELKGAMILTGSKDIKSIKRTSINY
jgi:isopentenyl diphosphate isomerase/L-lactate dehydrogenase-like FMN-dependent dehydrogenase